MPDYLHLVLSQRKGGGAWTASHKSFDATVAEIATNAENWSPASGHTVIIEVHVERRTVVKSVVDSYEDVL